MAELLQFSFQEVGKNNFKKVTLSKKGWLFILKFKFQYEKNDGRKNLMVISELEDWEKKDYVKKIEFLIFWYKVSFQ